VLMLTSNGEHMKSVIRNILAVVAGLVIGSIVNMSLIIIGGEVVSPPPGADVTTMEGLKNSIHLFEAKHFLFPFLAGGITNVLMLPSPLWFNIVDLVGAYIPMAWIGWKLASRKA
jgi:threonine/homoserine/homoserine lactone efflux protein